MPLRFEWNPDKASGNLGKHGISFDEAATIFDDPMFMTVLDDEHSNGEERYISIGFSRQNRLLLVAHTDRYGLIRIISARRATAREQTFYAEGI